MQRVGGSDVAVLQGAAEAPMEHRPSSAVPLTQGPPWGQGLVGGLAGVARPCKGIRGAQRRAQAGQKPAVEGKAKSPPDWIPKSVGSRGESRA